MYKLWRAFPGANNWAATPYEPMSYLDACELAAAFSFMDGIRYKPMHVSTGRPPRKLWPTHGRD